MLIAHEPDSYRQPLLQFWKQFFEFSANCSLSNYEDVSSSPEDITEQNEERLPLRGGVNEDVSETPRPTHHDMDDDTLMTDNISGSTPRPPTTRSIRTHSRFADFGSPYEDLRQELKGEAAAQEEEFEVDVSLGSVEDNEQRPEETEIISDSDADESALLAIHTRRLPDFSMTPKAPTTTLKLGDTAKGQSNDPLLHRVLDKNYRIQATPIRRIYSPIKGIRQPEVASKEETAALAWDSPMSSPEIMAPKLRSAAFMSPIKSSRQTGISDLKVTTAPRTPGISVQTPIAQKQRDVFASARRVRSGNDDIEIIPLGRDIGTAAKGTKEKGKALQRDEIGWDSSDDDELYGGFSPPKTIQFAMPQSKLMQTPGMFHKYFHQSSRPKPKRLTLFLSAGSE